MDEKARIEAMYADLLGRAPAPQEEAQPSSPLHEEPQEPRQTAREAIERRITSQPPTPNTYVVDEEAAIDGIFVKLRPDQVEVIRELLAQWVAEKAEADLQEWRARYALQQKERSVAVQKGRNKSV